MEKLLLISLLFSLPANLFMVVADVNGAKKWIARLFVKLPTYISLTLLVIYILKQFNII
jgi:hypothetical protein